MGMASKDQILRGILTSVTILISENKVVAENNIYQNI